MLTHKVAIITGGSRGIGAAIARTLAEHGARIVISYRVNETAAHAVVQAIQERGGGAICVQANVGNERDVVRIFEHTMEVYGRVDILVNNAAAGGLASLDHIDEAILTDTLNVNVRGIVVATREAARRIGKAGGRIINISSLNGRIPTPGASLYAATKAAVESLTKSYAAELGPRGITVNAVAPGFTETDMLAGVTPKESWPKLAEMTALRRIGRPEDIADVVAFLASAEARWITGQVIGADGGLMAF